jgi:hypothetical protein
MAQWTKTKLDSKGQTYRQPFIGWDVLADGCKAQEATNVRDVGRKMTRRESDTFFALDAGQSLTKDGWLYFREY